LNGARLPDTVYDPPLYFADQDWKKPYKQAYMMALQRHRPEMATVLDLEEGLFRATMDWAEEAAQWCRSVVIIPKVPGVIDDIPVTIGDASVILGYSVPTKYGGTCVPVWEFGRRPVHLLGGSPQKQLDLCRYLNVVSLDGNMAHLQAHRCRFWSRKKGSRGHWVQLSEAGDHREEDANLEAIRRSLVGIKEAWQSRLTEVDKDGE
jgi:hypothetical protein